MVILGGGAALSVRQVSGQPIKFVGTGEKVEALDPFYPERMASRILGMGDILTLVEKAQEEIDISDAEALTEKMLSAQFDFTDFLKQMRMIKGMGALGGLMKMIPGMNKLSDDQLQKGQEQLARAEAMINSMTRQERRNPDLLARSASRKRRVAAGSGFSTGDVTKLVSDFQRMRDMMSQMGGMMPGMGGHGDARNGWYGHAGDGGAWVVAATCPLRRVVRVGGGKRSGRPKKKRNKKKGGGNKGFGG